MWDKRSPKSALADSNWEPWKRPVISGFSQSAPKLKLTIPLMPTPITASNHYLFNPTHTPTGTHSMQQEGRGHVAHLPFCTFTNWKVKSQGLGSWEYQALLRAEVPTENRIKWNLGYWVKYHSNHGSSSTYKTK